MKEELVSHYEIKIEEKLQSSGIELHVNNGHFEFIPILPTMMKGNRF